MKHDNMKCHVNGLALIAYLRKHGGSAPESNGEIAAHLGITEDAFYDARNHLTDCPSAGGYVVSQRSQNKPLVLIDPKGTSNLLDLINARMRPVRSAHIRNQRRADTTLMRMIAVWEKSAEEASARGYTDLHRDLMQAVHDLTTVGRLHPSTELLLEKQGITLYA